MRWTRSIALCLFCFSLSLLSAQEPPTSSIETEPTSQSVSSRLRQIAERLRQATIDSQSDLEALLQEREALLLELKDLQTLSSDSEREARFMKDSYETSSSSLTSSMLNEEKERKAKVRWRGAAIIESLVLIGAALLL